MALPAAWSTPTCFVSDTTSSTADTIMVIGAAPRPDPPSAVTACGVPGASPETGPVVVHRDVVSGSDLRDALDIGVGTDRRRPDVVITRDRDLVAFAERRPDYFVTALPWTSTYVFLTSWPPTAISEADRDALARDAVTGAARGAAPPFSWLADTSCSSAPFTRIGSPVVAYAATDPVARQLAERMVSVARYSRVLAVPEGSLRATLDAGDATAAVMPVDRDLRRRCGTRNDTRVAANAVPLVDTRAHAIVRRGTGATFIVAPDGSLHFMRRSSR